MTDSRRLHGRCLLSILALTTALAIALQSVRCPAATVVSLDALDLVRGAELILHGTCTERSSYRDTRGLIVTRYNFEVTESLKGDAGRTLTFVQPGGECRGIATIIPGLSSHQVGDELVLFLAAISKNAAAQRLPVGLDQGVYRVSASTDPAAPGKTVGRRLANLERVRARRPAGRELAEFPEEVDLASFKSAVRRCIAESEEERK